MVDNIVRCSKCGKEICYIPNSYKMGCNVNCIKCGALPARTRIGKAIKRTAVGNYIRVKKGIRKDVHPKISFRSPTEANFARILEYHSIPWKYEERAFTFDGYKTKPHVYIMDFEIIGKATKNKNNLIEGLQEGFYEIKGYMDIQSKKKLQRLRKQYPEDADRTCVVVYTKYRKKEIELCNKLKLRVMFYDLLTKHYEPLIKNWEGKK